MLATLPAPSVEADPWYRRMLGPTSLSWQVIVFAGILNFPQMVLTGGNLGARTVQPGEYPTIAAISAATILVSFIYGYLGHLTVFHNRHKQPVSLATFLVFYALGGMLYSVGIQISDRIAQSPSDIPFALRAVDAALVSIAWGIGVSLILDGRRRFQSERNALLNSLVEQSERSRTQGRMGGIDQSELTSKIEGALQLYRGDIQVAAERLHHQPASSLHVQQLAATIDSAADVAARASSHQAWEAALRSAAKPRFGQTLRTALTAPRIWPAPMAVLVSIGVPTVAVRNFGLFWGLPAAIGLGLLTWWWMRTVNKLPMGHRWQFALAYVGTAIVVTAFAVLPAPLTPQVSGEVGSIVIGLAGGFILVSFVATLQRERREILGLLAQGVLVEEAERLAEARAIAHVARRLHGPVQSRLRVCAAEIERAADQGDSEEIDAAVEAALQALRDAEYEGNSSPELLPDAIADLERAWEGFVVIDSVLDEASRELHGRDDVMDVLTEAIANAHHHGQATQASVRVKTGPAGVRIRVTDNGCAESVGQPGLGTRLIRNLADEYDLAVTPQGATLEVLLPMSRDQHST